MKDRVRAAATAALALSLAGCGSFTPPPPGPGPGRPKISFDEARARCGASVAESPAVQSCMRRLGWAYRQPWE